MFDRPNFKNNNQATNSDCGYASPPPAVTLPKGGGAIKGMGEKFAANLMTGTGSMSVPLATSPGRAGFGPQLSLSYDSGAGNGSFGFGWNLSLPSITRKTDKGLPQYLDMEESDVFILSGAEDLVPVLAEAGGSGIRKFYLHESLMALSTKFGGIGHGLKGCLPASNVGLTLPISATCTGTLFPKTTSSPSTARISTRVLPILAIRRASLAG